MKTSSLRQSYNIVLEMNFLEKASRPTSAGIHLGDGFQLMFANLLLQFGGVDIGVFFTLVVKVPQLFEIFLWKLVNEHIVAANVEQNLAQPFRVLGFCGQRDNNGLCSVPAGPTNAMQIEAGRA